jgi:copper chaperone
MADELTLTVTGMTCGGCESAVTRAVSRLPGVANVRASHAENRVTLTYDPAQASRDTIARQIEAAGYHVAR